MGAALGHDVQHERLWEQEGDPPHLQMKILVGPAWKESPSCCQYRPTDPRGEAFIPAGLS